MKKLLVLAIAACGGAPKAPMTAPPDTGSPRKTVTIGVEPIEGTGPGDGGGGGQGCREAPGDPLGGQCAPSKGVIEDGELQTVGAIDKAAVRKVVRENFEALRYCYEATLLANPNIAGTVMAKFTIQIDGSVVDVSAAGVHPDVEACVATKVKGFRFPKPDGASKVEVAYPFTFKPS
jgi:hypothetical protein